MMKEATFYILDKKTPHDRYLFACRLAEKANHQELSVVISMTSLELAQHIDALLWNYRADSFLPHDLKQVNVNSEVINLITIGTDTTNKTRFDISLNLDSHANTSLSLATRHIEIATQDQDMLKKLRQEYKALTKNSIPVEVHDFTKSA